MSPRIEELRSSAEASAQLFVLRNKVKLLERDMRLRDERAAGVSDQTRSGRDPASLAKQQWMLLAFDPDRVEQLTYPESQTFKDVCFHREEALDLYRSPFVLLLLCAGENIPALRVAFDSSQAGDWSETTERYLDLVTGCNLISLTGEEMEASPGKSNLAEVRHVSVGGWGADASVRVWALCGSDNLIAPRVRTAVPRADTTPATEPLGPRSSPEAVEKLEIATASLRYEISVTQAALSEANQKISFIDGYPYRAAVAYRRLPRGLRAVVGKLLRPAARSAAAVVRRFR
jgi:hypothetical protein